MGRFPFRELAKFEKPALSFSTYIAGAFDLI